MKTFSKSEKLEPTNATWLEKAREDLENLRRHRKLEHSEATWLERPKEDLSQENPASLRKLKPAENTFKIKQAQENSRNLRREMVQSNCTLLHFILLPFTPSIGMLGFMCVCVCGCASVSVHCSPKIHCRSPYSRSTILKKNQ
jgi:hypothetical protein